MKARLTHEFRFEASHQLNHLSSDHPCYRLHGHSYAVVIEVTGDVNEATGFLVDYADIVKAVQPVIDRLDHNHLNDVPGLRIASAEFIAAWLWKEIKPHLPILFRISVAETALTRCEYSGD